MPSEELSAFTSFPVNGVLFLPLFAISPGRGKLISRIYYQQQT